MFITSNKINYMNEKNMIKCIKIKKLVIKNVIIFITITSIIKQLYSQKILKYNYINKNSNINNKIVIFIQNSKISIKIKLYS